MYDFFTDLFIDPTATVAARVLSFLYQLPVIGGSFGLATIMLTLVVMVVLMPLTLKATKSTIKMTQVQPLLRDLQKEHKDDKAALNAAMMELYKENGVNPVGGCLPMLIQLPVFLVLFNVLRGLTRRNSDRPYFGMASRASELAGRAEAAPKEFYPRYINEESQLYADLIGETEMKFGPFDLALQASEVVSDNFITALPYLVLIIFVVGTSYYQQRQVSRRRGPAPKNPTPQERNMQMMTRVIPLFTLVTGFIFPAALVLYWATSNLFRIGQQSYITRSLYKEGGEGKKAEEIRLAARDSKDDGEDDDDLHDDDLIGDGKPVGKSAKKSNGGKAKSSGSSNGNKNAGSKNGTKNNAKSDSNGSSKNGSGSSNSGSDKTGDRQEAWERRRQQKAKAQARKKSVGTSSRVTPRGTKPTETKKKRKK